jgi:hypothetical protein
MFKKSVTVVALTVLVICVYSFLLGNRVFEGKFENDALSWYFLAKGAFCSSALYLLAVIADKISEKK